MGGEGGTVGGGVVQVVAVPWGWYFRGTVEMVPWVGKAVPWEVVLCRYREGGTLGTALWRYRGDVLRRYRGVGTVGGEGGTVGFVPWAGKAVP